MKRLALICVALLATASFAAAANPKIMVQVTIAKELGFEKSDSIAATLENFVAMRIRNEFPCAECITPHDLRNFLDFARMRAVIGVPADQEAEYEQGLRELAGAVGVDYIVAVDATAAFGSWRLNGKWLDVRKVQALARVTETLSPNGDALIDATERIADRLSDDAAYFEICPYTGPVKITIHTSRADRPEPESRPVECKGMGGQYVKTRSLDRTSDTAIELVRKARPAADGTVDLTMVETEDIEEMDPCHLCPSGARGARIYTEHRRTEIRISGFSDESRTVDRNLQDVRVYLKFAEDGTFRLELAGATKKGAQHVKITRKAEGICDTKFDKPNEDSTAPCDVPLGQIFGPFPGKPTDKMLSAKQEFRTTDPVTKEESTIVVDLTLQRQ